MNYNSYKKEMLVELCARNYVTSNGFVNGVNNTFKISTTYCEKTIIWIMFHNSKIGTLNDNNVESKWTIIEPIIKYIKVSKSQSFTITRIQFPIQLATIRIIHHSEGLSLNELIFDPTYVKIHGLTLSHI
jgi:hypothetical protein